MAKRSILTVITMVVLIIFLLTACNSQQVKTNSNMEEVFSLWFCPIGSTTKIYEFILLKDNTLQVSFNGDISNLHLDSEELSSFNSQREITLSNIQTNKIINLINEIQEDNNYNSNTIGYTDVWEINLSYNNQVLTEPFVNESTKMNELGQLLVELSPIEIDLWGFA